MGKMAGAIGTVAGGLIGGPAGASIGGALGGMIGGSPNVSGAMAVLLLNSNKHIRMHSLDLSVLQLLLVRLNLK